MRAEFNHAGEYKPDMLLAGSAELLSARVVTLAEGQILPRGAVLGMVTATTEFKLSALHEMVTPEPTEPPDGEEPPAPLAPVESPITDGSQVPDVVLAEAVDTTTGPRAAIAFTRGDFAAQALTLGLGHTLETVTEPLRERGIAVVSIVE
jgi:hypothetical protein